MDGLSRAEGERCPSLTQKFALHCLSEAGGGAEPFALPAERRLQEPRRLGFRPELRPSRLAGDEADVAAVRDDGRHQVRVRGDRGVPDRRVGDERVVRGVDQERGDADPGTNWPLLELP